MNCKFMSRAFTCLIAFGGLLASALAQESGSPALSVQQIVAQMVSRNRERARALKSYTGMRHYHLVYTGFPGKREAEILVSTRVDAPDGKEFTVVSQTGSGFVVNKVLKRLLESEKEANTAEQRARTALNEQNYEFQLLGQEDIGQRPAYVLAVIPKIDNKFLYRGKIWVDSEPKRGCTFTFLLPIDNT